MTEPSTVGPAAPAEQLKPPRFLLVGVGLAALALVVVIAVAIWSSMLQDERRRMVEHTLTVQQAITDALSSLQDAETGQRGFLLTRDPAYLTPYQSAVQAIHPQLDELSRLVADNPEQVARIDAWRAETETKLSELATTVEAARAGNYAAALTIVADGQGKGTMDRIRSITREMRQEESALLANRTVADRRSNDQVQLAILAAALSALVLGGMIFLVLQRFTRALSVSGVELRAKNEQLEQEIAARRETEGQLVQSQKMEAVGQLTGGIAHDFNNMLAVVLSALGLLRRRMAAGDKDVFKFVDAAEDGARRAATLTNRLLAFSRRQPLSPELVDPNRLVGGMSELLRRTLGEQIELETVQAGGLWRAKIDPSQLENSILNLAVNARDAMPQGGKITIETANCHLDDRYAASNVGIAPGQYVLIAVTDNGPGMAPDVLARAFEPFFTTKPVGKGTGLGLSQVYGFVKQSEGHIKIYSEVGAGTTVKLYLPRARGELEQQAEEAAPAPLPPPPEGVIVLVVEDDDKVRDMTVASLRELGYLVVHAARPADALEKIRQLPKIDLLFTDVVMPEMNGRQLADAAMKLRPEMPVLFTTGYTQNAIVHNGILDPGTDLLIKPASIDQVALKVSQALAKARR